MPKVRRRTASGAPKTADPMNKMRSTKGNDTVDDNTSGGTITFINAQDAVEQSTAAMDAMNPLLAQELLSVAAIQFPTDPTIFELLGTVELECVNVHSTKHQNLLAMYPEEQFEMPQNGTMDPKVGSAQVAELDRLMLQSLEQASAAFQHAIELLPNEGYSKYLYMGQLTSADVALSYYRKGLEIMEADLNKMVTFGGEKNEQDAFELRTRMSKALCAMTDIYMTDCCDNPEAESSCVEFTTRALQLHPTNAEAFQTLASVCISRQMKSDALSAAEMSLNLWYPTYYRMKNDSNSEDDKDENGNDPNGTSIDYMDQQSTGDNCDDGNDDDEKMQQTNDEEQCEDGREVPEFSARVALAKIFLELESYHNAVKVLESLLDENDEDCDVLYLASLTSFFLAGGNLGENGSDDEPTINSLNMADNSDVLDSLADARDFIMQLLHVANIVGGLDESMITQATKMLLVVNNELDKTSSSPSC